MLAIEYFKALMLAIEYFKELMLAIEYFKALMLAIEYGGLHEGHRDRKPGSGTNSRLGPRTRMGLIQRLKMLWKGRSSFSGAFFF